MIPPELIPTRLIYPSERSRVPIEPFRPPSRFRGLFLLVQLARLAAAALWLKVTWRFTPTRFARHVRTFLLRMGTVWLKLGQTLGMRSDLLSVEFAAEMATLRERGAGVPFDVVRERVEQELGAPIEKLFEEFAEAPFTASTSFQLHRARLLRERVWVAVKVIRPFAEKTRARDLRLLRRVAGWLQFLRIFPKMRWYDLFREVEEVSTRELDLRFEAAALRQLRQTLPPHGVYVPEVFRRYCTRRVLVMEFIHAALMADCVELQRTDPGRLKAWFAENDIRPRALARRLFHSVWRQIFEDNFFHADMHPDNVIVLRGGRLGVLDCRSVGQLEADSLAKHRRFIQALADGEYATAAEYSFLLAARLPLVDLGEVKAQIVRVWRRWESWNNVRELPAAEKSMTGMLDGLNRVMYRHHFETQWSLARLSWTLVNVDASILPLASDVNYLQWLREYFRAAGRRANRISLKEIAERSVNTLATVLELPKTLSGNSIAQQEVLRRQARVIRGTTTKTGHLLAAAYSFAAAVMLLLAVVGVSAFLDQHSPVQVESVLGPQLTAAVRTVPAIGFRWWVGGLAVVLFLGHRATSRKRGYLDQGAVRRRDARPAI